MRNILRRLGAVCTVLALLMLLAVPVLAHHVIDVDASVNCEGYSVSASANVFDDRRFVVRIDTTPPFDGVDGVNVYNEIIVTNDSSNVVEVGPFVGSATEGFIQVIIFFAPDTFDVEDSMTTSFVLSENCEPEPTTTTTTIIEETTTSTPPETTTTTVKGTTTTTFVKETTTTTVGDSSTTTTIVESTSTTESPVTTTSTVIEETTTVPTVPTTSPPPSTSPELPTTGLNVWYMYSALTLLMLGLGLVWWSEKKE